ncbi:hypothetical protein EKI60_06225 [Candidatus Saccharibacteria bacterium]|nr:MAG: hypothetical protein EKI60_06225 [Candidatus Saccharibacteria bacterium]
MKKDQTIVKVGTGVVSNYDRTRIDHAAMASIGQDIAAIEGVHVGSKTERLDHEGSVVLVSSGAVTAGKEKLGLDTRLFTDIRMKQMAAMVGNTMLFQLWEQATGITVGHDLPTHNDLSHQEHWDNMAGVVATNLQYGVLSVFNDGDARSTEELEETVRRNGREMKRFGDNDQLAAQLGLNLHAFANSLVTQSTRVIFLTDTDGVREDACYASSRLSAIAASDLDAVIDNCVVTTETESNGGMESKLLAAKDLALAGIPVSIGAGKDAHALQRLYQYDANFGTHILV